jgi:hypothetical protein
MSEMRELLDTELDSVSGGQHGYYGGHQALFEKMGLFDFGNTGNSNSGNIVNNIVNFFNFGNIVVEQNNIALQIGVAVGDHASVTNLIGSQTNLSSIGSIFSSQPLHA